MSDDKRPRLGFLRHLSRLSVADRPQRKLVATLLLVS